MLSWEKIIAKLYMTRGWKGLLLRNIHVGQAARDPSSGVTSRPAANG